MQSSAVNSSGGGGGGGGGNGGGEEIGEGRVEVDKMPMPNTTRISNRTLRNDALATLGLRCMFPASIETDYVGLGNTNKSLQLLRYCTARSMLEAITDEKVVTPFDSILEDVVIRCIERCEQADSRAKLSSTEV
jgi:hypothetical protein